MNLAWCEFRKLPFLNCKSRVGQLRAFQSAHFLVEAIVSYAAIPY